MTEIKRKYLDIKYKNCKKKQYLHINFSLYLILIQLSVSFYKYHFDNK